jgi:hypothetical protein
VPQPFAEDDGQADPGLLAALAAVAGPDQPPSVDGYGAVVRALAQARLLVAVRAVTGDGHPLPSHDRGDAGADLGLALLTGADGRRALPVFGSVAALASWDPAARPVPVEAARAAQAAVAERCDAMVLDAAGPMAFVVRRSAVWAVAQGRDWLPAAQDGQVRAAVDRALAGLAHVVGAQCEPGRRADLRVLLQVEPGLTAAELEGLVCAARSALAGDDVIAERVDSLELTVLPGRAAAAQSGTNLSDESASMPR